MRGADDTAMRKATWLVAWALAGTLASGCFVFEELDRANELSSRGAATRKAPEEARPAAPASKPAGPGVLERVEAWWVRFRTPPPPPPHPDDVAVLCRLGGRTLYTHKRDCLARGGTVESAAMPPQGDRAGG